MTIVLHPTDIILGLIAATLFGAVAGYAVRWWQERTREPVPAKRMERSRPAFDALARPASADTWLPGRGFGRTTALPGAGAGGARASVPAERPDPWHGAVLEKADSTVEAPAPRAADGIERPLVLVVDDRLELRAVHGAYLQKHGYEVLMAADGDTALALVREHHPAVVVLDHSLPRRTGIEVARAVRADPDTADIPIVLMTAHSYGAIGRAARDAGVAAFLPKPVDPSRVLREVDRLVRSHPQH